MKKTNDQMSLVIFCISMLALAFSVAAYARTL